MTEIINTTKGIVVLHNKPIKTNYTNCTMIKQADGSFTLATPEDEELFNEAIKASEGGDE